MWEITVRDGWGEGRYLVPDVPQSDPVTAQMRAWEMHVTLRECDAIERYRRLVVSGPAVAEATRRADAAGRLDAAIRGRRP